MIKYTHVCEKCGKEEPSKSSSRIDGWNEIKVEIERGRYSSKTVRVTMCVDCSNQLGLNPKESPKETQYSEAEDKMKTMLDLFAELIYERMQN